MTRIYKEEHSKSKELKFRDFIAKAIIPYDLPLPSNQSISKWARETVLDKLDQDSYELYGIAMKVYNPRKISCIDDQLALARQKAAKFWNRWGNKLNQKNIRIEDISTMLKSSAHELKLLAFLELAHCGQSQWDEGAGKSGLFIIARKAQVYIDGNR